MNHDSEITLSGPMAMIAPMLPMVLSMIDDTAIDSMAELLGVELLKQGIEEIETYGENLPDEGSVYEPVEFAKLILHTMFNTMKGGFDTPVNDSDFG